MKIVILLLIFLCVYSFLSADNFLGKDKVMHFTSSAFITCWNYGFSKDILSFSERKSMIISINFTGILGFGKEFSDKYIKKTKFSWKDITYDLAGIALGTVIINNSNLK